MAVVSLISCGSKTPERHTIPLDCHLVVGHGSNCISVQPYAIAVISARIVEYHVIVGGFLDKDALLGAVLAEIIVRYALARVCVKVEAV